jgi:hypothetical protein
MSRGVDINGRGVRVAGRGVGVGSAIPDSVVERDPGNSSASRTGKRGIEIAVGSDYGEFGQIKAKISNNVSGVTRAQILKMSDSSVVDEQDVSGLSASDVFTFDAVLQQNTNYSVILDAEGSSYTAGFDTDPSFPYSDPNIDIDIVGGVRAGGTTSASDPSVILGVGGYP